MARKAEFVVCDQSIYDHFSAGVHKLDEQTAVQVADDIASALDRVRGGPAQ
jgi:hypothetical protein